MTSFPPDFVARMQSILPSSRHAAFFEMMATPLRKSIRVNTLKISVENFQKLAKEEEWKLTPIPWCPTGFWIDRASHATPLGKTWLHAAGLFYIQEAASMLPPELLLADCQQARSRDRAFVSDEKALTARADDGSVVSFEKALTVLDVAAAPGSKTTQLAALMKNSGCIIANEPVVKRIKSLSHNVELAGAGIVQLARKDGRAFAKYFPNTFDAILLDAPCTGEGTARKDPRALLKWNINRIRAMADLQLALAVAAVHALRAGGTLVYSTCTLAPEENEGVVSRLLAMFPKELELIPVDGANGITSFEDQSYDPRVAGTRRLWPDALDCEGFFAAKLQKIAPTKCEHKEAEKRSVASPFRRVLDKHAAELLGQMTSWFGCAVALPAGTSFFIRDDELWLRPRAIESFATKLNFERTGNRVAKLSREGRIIRVTHLGASLLIREPTRHVLELNEKERDEFLSGRDVIFSCHPGRSEHASAVEGSQSLEKRDSSSSSQTPQNDTIESEDGQSLVRYRGYLLGLGLLRDGKIKNQLPRDFIVS